MLITGLRFAFLAYALACGLWLAIRWRMFDPLRLPPDGARLALALLASWIVFLVPAGLAWQLTGERLGPAVAGAVAAGAAAGCVLRLAGWGALVPAVAVPLLLTVSVAPGARFAEWGAGPIAALVLAAGLPALLVVALPERRTSGAFVLPAGAEDWLDPHPAGVCPVCRLSVWRSRPGSTLTALRCPSCSHTHHAYDVYAFGWRCPRCQHAVVREVRETVHA